ncbi:MAG TPA: hypothetical protein PKZ53_21845 [Acidobacteriota bacterium]|nr:hypothetical protein [Acidobacteriota bacterium]HNG94536.1 hypothetical protein [Acidobacteriota bacterium]HNJ43142.1 hypothetical protein [Acidobacteriota bacterium]
MKPKADVQYFEFLKYSKISWLTVAVILTIFGLVIANMMFNQPQTTQEIASVKAEDFFAQQAAHQRSSSVNTLASHKANDAEYLRFLSISGVSPKRNLKTVSEGNREERTQAN